MYECEKLNRVGLSSLEKRCFTRGTNEAYRMTATVKMNREGQFTISYNTAKGRIKLFSPAKCAILSRGGELRHFTPVKSDQPCRILGALAFTEKSRTCIVISKVFLLFSR